jgi:hypothetical protein
VPAQLASDLDRTGAQLTGQPKRLPLDDAIRLDDDEPWTCGAVRTAARRSTPSFDSRHSVAI